MEGESLRQRLIRETRLQIDDIIAITRDVADALSYAHSYGGVHRDIKPDSYGFVRSSNVGRRHYQSDVSTGRSELALDKSRSQLAR